MSELMKCDVCRIVYEKGFNFNDVYIEERSLSNHPERLSINQIGGIRS